MILNIHDIYTYIGWSFFLYNKFCWRIDGTNAFHDFTHSFYICINFTYFHFIYIYIYIRNQQKIKIQKYKSDRHGTCDESTNYVFCGLLAKRPCHRHYSVQDYSFLLLVAYKISPYLTTRSTKSHRLSYLSLLNADNSVA